MNPPDSENDDAPTLWSEAEGLALHSLLVASGCTVAVAESMTVGRVQSELGRWSGASAYYAGGVTAYTLIAKTTLLGVDAAHAATVDGVSDRVAAQMALGVAKRFGTTFGLATTGYAEPREEDGIRIAYAWVAMARGRRAQVQCVTASEKITAQENTQGAREEMQAYVTTAVLRLLAAELKRGAIA
jgi:nicotinamide-nucleotide amidase